MKGGGTEEGGIREGEEKRVGRAEEREGKERNERERANLAACAKVGGAG